MFSRTQGHTHHIFCRSPSFSSSCSNWKVAVVDMDMRLPGCPLGRTCLGSKWPAAHCPCRALQRDASPEITPFPGQPTSKQGRNLEAQPFQPDVDNSDGQCSLQSSLVIWQRLHWTCLEVQLLPLPSLTSSLSSQRC